MLSTTTSVVVVIRIGEVVVVVRGCLEVVVQWALEGWKGIEAGAGHVWPVPLLVDRLGEASNDGDTLVGDRGRVCILVAHHYQSLSVYSKEVVKLGVAFLETGNLSVNLVEAVEVFHDLHSVVFDVGVVLVNVAVVV